MEKNLYILIPYQHDITYNNYMNNYFEFNNWDDLKSDNIKFIYIDKYQDIYPNKNDYLLVCDIQSINIKEYYEKYIYLFKKENRFVFIYECLLHDIHKWKIEYIRNNFCMIFQNCHDIKDTYWIPCCNIFIKHENYENKKTGFCAVSPIFDLGLQLPLDIKRMSRIEIIREYCELDCKIHVYGNDEWEKYIRLINYVGKLPNETSADYLKRIGM